MSQNRIIYTTDFSPASQAALPWVRKLSDVLEAEVHCVTAVQDPATYAPMIGAGPVTFPSLQQIKADAETQLKGFVKAHLSGLAKPPVITTLTGRAADEIVAYANGIGATMIVMATHGRSGLAHIVIGSTTEEVVRTAKCPVLSVRAS
jgi:nucleotide-binding universal stress UspA family protein